MYTLFHASRKGFTLIEMMIVISIIGILATALYPSVTWYLERAKIVQYQSLARETGQMIKNYISEVWAIDETTPSYNFCETTCSLRHDGLSDYITRNAPHIWQDIDRLKFPPYINSLPIYYSNIHFPQMNIWWYVFPNRDITSQKKVPALIWVTPWAPEVEPGQYINISWTSLWTSADKRCSPWFAWSIENYYDGSDTYIDTYCMYFLE